MLVNICLKCQDQSWTRVYDIKYNTACIYTISIYATINYFYRIISHQINHQLALYAASSGATLGAAVRRRPAVAVVAGVAILVAVAVDTFVVARSIVLVRERLVIFVLLEERAAAFGVAGKNFYVGSSTKTRT